jgi:hypothetical protein
MRATASCWNLGDLVCSIIRCAIPRDVAFLRMLCECTPFAPFFGCLWPLSSCYSLERVCPSVFGRPVLLSPILTSHTDVACAHLRWSILATWPPHYNLRQWATVTISFVFVLCRTSSFVAPYNLQYSPFHLPLTSLEHPPFFFRERPRFVAVW